jgi:RNAse (barnase) inhibitor barstar
MLYMANVRGQHVHAVQADEASLERELRARGYQVYVMDGSRIVDERTFRREVTRTLGLPEYGADGWDAFRDVLFDVTVPVLAHQAVIWKDADLLFAADAQAFLDGFSQLYQWAWATGTAGTGVSTTDRQLFLLGTGKGFGVRLRF